MHFRPGEAEALPDSLPDSQTPKQGCQGQTRPTWYSHKGRAAQPALRLHRCSVIQSSLTLPPHVLRVLLLCFGFVRMLCRLGPLKVRVGRATPVLILEPTLAVNSSCVLPL
jgi:hypothetical protein